MELGPIDFKKIAQCKSGTSFIELQNSARSAWFECERVDWLIQVLKSVGYDRSNNLRKFCCKCARITPFGDKKAWDYVQDIRTKSCVILLEDYLGGLATKEDLSFAEIAAWSAPEGEKKLGSIFPLLLNISADPLYIAEYFSWKVSLLSGNIKKGLAAQANFLREEVQFDDTIGYLYRYLENRTREVNK